MAKISLESSILTEFKELKGYIDKQKSEKDKRGAWNKCKGDITSRLFSHYIREAIKGKYDISDPNSFIEGFSREFDLLILKKGKKPARKYTSMYKLEDVVFCLEFKSYKSFKSDEQLKDYAENFKRNKKIKILCLTMLISDGNFEKLKKEFEHDIECFRICKGTDKYPKPCEGEWERFKKKLEVSNGKV